MCERGAAHRFPVRVNAGVSAAALLHATSLRGHRDCFEKCHVIADQKLSCSRGGRSAYQGLKLAVSQKLNRIIQYTQNSVSLGGPGRQAAGKHCYSQQGNKQPPQADLQVPRYTRCWGLSKAAAPGELDLLPEPPSEVWPGGAGGGGGGGPQRRKQPAAGIKPDPRTWPKPSRDQRKLQDCCWAHRNRRGPEGPRTQRLPWTRSSVREPLWRLLTRLCFGFQCVT